jgi:cell division protein ZapE
MILRRLFAELFNRGVVVVATSNRAPVELYKNGIQRASFLPFIDLIQARCAVVALSSGTDYRLMGTQIADTFFSPTSPSSSSSTTTTTTAASGDGVSAAFAAAFDTCVGGAVVERNVDIHVMQGRTLTVPACVRKAAVAADAAVVVSDVSGGVALFSFEDLCRSNRGASDYIALTAAFDTVFLKDVPILDLAQINELRRFILLVDELYQANTRVVFSAAAPPNRLLPLQKGAAEVRDEAFAWHRTESRLVEMQSQEYADRWRSKHMDV